MESKSPREAWDNIKVLSMRDGVQTASEEQKRPRWAGFKNTSGKEELTRCFTVMFDLGRSSILRELKDQDCIEKWFEILKGVRRSCLSQRE